MSTSAFDPAKFDVRFSRVQSNAEHEYRLRLEDSTSGLGIAELTFTGDQFAELLTGMHLSRVPGDLLAQHFRDRLGKRMEHHTVKFGFVNKTDEEEALRGWAAYARVMVDADTTTITRHNWGTAVMFRWYRYGEEPELDMAKVEELLPARPGSVPAAR